MTDECDCDTITDVFVPVLTVTLTQTADRV